MGRSVRHLLLLALAVTVGYVAAPALSSQPYLPEAVDFEQRLPGVEPVMPSAVARGSTGGADVRRKDEGGPSAADKHPGEGPVSFRSAAISAPERFDLVGLAGEMRPLELRAREEGAEWSEWVETANGDPVYFGGADEVQLRARGWRPSGTLHYVNVSGTTSPIDSLLNDARSAINGAFISLTDLVAPAAEAAPTRPAIVKRSAWGANRTEGGCLPRETPITGRVKAGVVHHTVTSDKYTAAEAPSIVLGICRYHRNANGWNDIGYNALVDRFGTIYTGRAGGIQRAVIGAHAQGFNAQTTGVASIGTHTSTGVTPAAMEGFVSFLAWKLWRHGVPAKGTTSLTSAGGSASRYSAGTRVVKNRITGHGSLGLTACPGDGLKLQLGKIRRRTAARIGGAPPPEYIPPTPEPAPIPLPTDDGAGGVPSG